MWDAIVVGGRCAGAPLAMLLARLGRRVLVVDRARFPSDTTSTHFIQPRGTSRLARWGLEERLLATGCPPLAHVRLDYGDVALSGRPGPVDGVDAMYAPRRTVLDHLLLGASAEAGAEVREEVLMQDLVVEDGRVRGVRLRDRRGNAFEERGRIVVGADGMQSRVARLAGAGFRCREAPLTCVYLAYWRGVAGAGVEFYLRPNRLILVFPTHDDLACVYVGWPTAEFDAYRRDVAANHRATLDLVPELAARVDAGERVTAFRGSNKLENFHRVAAGPGWALVGDAAYHRDPTTGFGIADAFVGAELLADAIDRGLDGDLDAETAAYGEALVGATEDLLTLTLRSARLSDPAPMRAFYRAVAQDPAETRRLMEVVCGQRHHAEVFNAANVRRWSKGG